MSAKDAALDSIWGSCEQLEPDAVRVLARIAERLVVGQKVHGILDVAKDPRDWVRELSEEVYDGLVYTALVALRAEQLAATTNRGRQDDGADSEQG